MVFDWPSEVQLFGYLADEESAEWAAPHLAHFLWQVHVAAPEATIDIVSHSMGSRVVTMAMRDLDCQGLPGASKMFGHVIFVAPDIDVDIFRDTAMRQIHGNAVFTVYGSSTDQALALSKWLHHHKREGERPDQFTIDTHSPPWFESVDVSKVDTSELGHSYYDGGVAQVMLDLQAVIHDEDAYRTATWNAAHSFRVLSASK
jgi:esterase/lipase superfamily enzyme